MRKRGSIVSKLLASMLAKAGKEKNKWLSTFELLGDKITLKYLYVFFL